jgi:glucose/arabinose dehydrogenase
MMLFRNHAVCSAVILSVALGCNGTDATDGGPLPPGLALQLDPFVTEGLSSPVFLTQPLDDGRIFVVEQTGRIRIVRDGVLQPTPFLDLSGRVLFGGERGLLSVAFDPRYTSNHFFYVYFTTQTNGDIRIERFTSTNADAADPASSKLILTVPHSQQANHNGGLLSFGPDGMLYAGLGDGGGGGDPFGNGQNTNALLASLLRIDVDHGDPYAIPSNNPYASGAGGAREIWAKGLRNPWRYAFDAPTGLLYIADVGQDAHEEVDVEPATAAGLNYGWNITEGLSCYNASSCTRTGLTSPVIDYPHTNGACSITGGYVYRGSAIPAIVGHYFYSDYCAGFLRSFRYSNGSVIDEKDWGLTMNSVTSFGVDITGELYIIAGSTIYRIVQVQ